MKKNIFFILIGLIIGICISVGASSLYKASDIEFMPNDASWNVTNLEEALNELYTKSNDYKDFKYGTFDLTTTAEIKTIDVGFKPDVVIIYHNEGSYHTMFLIDDNYSTSNMFVAWNKGSNSSSGYYIYSRSVYNYDIVDNGFTFSEKPGNDVWLGNFNYIALKR